MMSSQNNIILNLLGDGKVIAFRPDFGRALGSPMAALFLCQAIYWQGVQRDGEWFFKKRDAERNDNGDMLPPSSGLHQSWEWELGGMGRGDQERARKLLIEKGLIEEKLCGIPARLNFRVNLNKVAEFILNISNNQRLADSSHLAGQNPPAVRSKSADLQVQTCQPVGCIYPPNTKTTPKNTTKTTPPTATASASSSVEKVAVVDIEEYVTANLWFAKKSAKTGGRPVLNEINYKKRIRERIKENGVDESDKETLQLFIECAEKKQKEEQQQADTPHKPVTLEQIRQMREVLNKQPQ